MDNKLPFKQNSFDAVVIIGALQYVMNINQCLSEINRVLKKEGIFILAQTNAFGINEIITPRRFFQFLMRTIFNEQFMYSYSTTLKSILTENKKLKKKNLT